MTKSYILEYLKAHKQELNEKFGLVSIGLFGSYAKDMADENSDIDLVIQTKNKDFFIRDDIREYLQQEFKTPVDIGYLESFRGYYRSKIENEIIYV